MNLEEHITKDETVIDDVTFASVDGENELAFVPSVPK
jgi:hypothetical protein